MSVKYIIVLCDELDLTPTFNHVIAHFCYKLSKFDGLQDASKVSYMLLRSRSAVHTIATQENISKRDLDPESAGQNLLNIIAQNLVQSPIASHNFVILLSHYGCESVRLIRAGNERRFSELQYHIESLTSAQNTVLNRMDGFMCLFPAVVDVVPAVLKTHRDGKMLIHGLPAVKLMRQCELRRRRERLKQRR